MTEQPGGNELKIFINILFEREKERKGKEQKTDGRHERWNRNLRGGKGGKKTHMKKYQGKWHEAGLLTVGKCDMRIPQAVFLWVW